MMQPDEYGRVYQDGDPVPAYDVKDEPASPTPEGTPEHPDDAEEEVLGDDLHAVESGEEPR
jgi:hypothetical protein